MSDEIERLREEIRFVNEKNEELTKQLNERNSEIQIHRSEEERQTKQTANALDQLQKKIDILEEEKQQFIKNNENWVQTYNTTMDLVYQMAFNLLNVYNSRRLVSMGAQNGNTPNSV